MKARITAKKKKKKITVEINGAEYRIARGSDGKPYLKEVPKRSFEAEIAAKQKKAAKSKSSNPGKGKLARGKAGKRENPLGGVCAPAIDGPIPPQFMPRRGGSQDTEQQLSHKGRHSNRQIVYAVTLKLDAFDAKEGIGRDELSQIIDSFEALLRIPLKDYEKTVDIEIRIRELKQGCMLADLLVILSLNIDVNVVVNQDIMSTLSAFGTSVCAYFALKDHTKPKACEGPKNPPAANDADDFGGDDGGGPGGSSNPDLPEGSGGGLLDFLIKASNGGKGDVTITARLDGQQADGGSDAWELNVTREEILALEQRINT